MLVLHHVSDEAGLFGSAIALEMYKLLCVSVVIIKGLRARVV